MWIKTVDDGYINLDNMAELRKTYVREHKYVLVVAQAAGSDDEYFLAKYPAATDDEIDAALEKAEEKINLIIEIDALMKQGKMQGNRE